MKKSKKIFVYTATVIIGLLALLSYTITQSGRGSHMVVDSDLIIADQIAKYGGDIKQVVTRMLQEGIHTSDLDFTLPDEPEHRSSNLNSVFEQKDAPQLPSKALAEKAFDGQIHYVFTSANRIPGIGTDAPEIIFITWPLKNKVCNEMNKGLGLGIDWAENHILSTPPDLTPFHHETGRPVTELIAIPKGYYGAAACAQDKNGVRYYIHTIVER